MIPFASQRASGQDLATHLLNTYDNEQVEVASVRGAIARDLHGAFAEWEAIAHALTRCRKYLYSLSINPDPAQAPLTRAQYTDYIERVEDSLNLTGQPRAIVYHIKPDKTGHPREHCHVVWSRIDFENNKAVHIAFDREKLMKVTRGFARDHDLRLPDGYHRNAETIDGGDDDDHHRHDQLSLYEKGQQDRTGITKEQRLEEVTEAWRQSDSAGAFVQALEERGYILANGRRPYVLIDRYGEMNALPKLINDRTVRTKDICSFLEKDFPSDSLPSVDEARALAAQRGRAQDNFDDAWDQEVHRQNCRAQLSATQADRRHILEKESAALTASHAAQEFKLAACQQDEIRALEITFHDEMKQVRAERSTYRLTSLVALFGRLPGIAFVIRKIQGQMERYRRRKHLKARTEIERRHKREQNEQDARQHMQRLIMAGRFRTLDQIERREMRSLDTACLSDGRVRERFQAPTQEQARQCDPDELTHHDPYYIDLQEVFERAARGDDGDSGGGEKGEGNPRTPKSKTASKRHTKNYNLRTSAKNTVPDH